MQIENPSMNPNPNQNQNPVATLRKSEDATAETKNATKDMHVLKRNGKLEKMKFDNILNRIKKACEDSGSDINYTALTIKIIDQLYDRIPTTKIDELTAEQCYSMASAHPDYAAVASRIIGSNHQKNTTESFSAVMTQLYKFTDKQGKPSPMISDATYAVVKKYKKELDAMADYSRDFLIDYFGFKTLERAYLSKINKKIVERIQHMWLRVSVGIHGDSLQRVQETYDLMSQKYFVHATPTLFNAGTPHPQLSSCYLLSMESDSIEGIFNTLSECAVISKWAGGIGMHIHNVRAKGSHIRGTNGHSNGLVPMLRVFNNTAKFVDQGGGKRNGSIAIYLEPWHADVQAFLQMKKNHGEEELKARDLFYAMWIPDLFMQRMHTGGQWTLFCPDECPGLADVWGAEFEALYTRYEQEGRGRETMAARDLWIQILDAQMETGTPYLLYKDTCNRKSNQQNLGTIKSSNLCTEIVEYSDPGETAVCNLGSIALPSFLIPATEGATEEEEVQKPAFDFDKLHEVAKVLTYNLNRVIDINYYPTPKTRTSNFKNRPVGIGVQGLADLFMALKLPFDSPAAKLLNKQIFETIYHGALEQSLELAKESGAYETFAGSPASRGVLQFDMWNVTPLSKESGGRYDWPQLKADIVTWGLKNSLLLAPMPTASTSQILGFNECFEPITSNIYSRGTNAGQFLLANKYLQNDLIRLGLWNEQVKNNIVANNGSVQQIDIIPSELRAVYRTVWEIPMKSLIDMAADRGAFICQSQSMNLWMEDPTYKTLTSMHYYSWKQGLKTGIYYLRRRAKHQAQKFTIEPTKAAFANAAAAVEEEYVCEMCSA